ncbi:hypothetical protein WJX74_010613 [Apatococcus lobatus]|uniref:GST C-terminal domain-containing protein n=2 Tax=Apatococcus TaxID=904362 RepID=A0AAW1SXA3_9CHLO
MTRPTFHYVPGSPWSFKTMWLLKLHLISLNVKEPIPILTEQLLRFRLKRHRISFPVLETATGNYFESFDMAQWAEGRSSSGVRLFPEGYAREIAEWNDKSDAMLACGRKTLIKNILEQDEVARAAVAALVPPLKYLGPIGPWFVRAIFGQINRKYAAVHAATNIDLCRKTLAELDAAVRQGNGYVVGGQFTYADITMATALSSIDFLQLPWTRSFLTGLPKQSTVIPGLAEQFPQLLAWRTAILEKHFPSKKPL